MKQTWIPFGAVHVSVERGGFLSLGVGGGFEVVLFMPSEVALSNLVALMLKITWSNSSATTLAQIWVLKNKMLCGSDS